MVDDRFRATGVCTATLPPCPDANETVIFMGHIEAGLLPLFSSFIAILESYNIHSLHLTPNSVMIFLTFAHLCETFVGVMPSVAVFRQYFILRMLSGEGTVGSCYFRFRNKLVAQYIDQTLQSKWEEILGRGVVLHEIPPHPCQIVKSRHQASRIPCFFACRIVICHLH